MRKIIAAVVAAAALGLAGTSVGASAATENSGWWQTNSNAAQSRANLTEKVLTPTAVTKVKHLRSVLAQSYPKNSYCGPGSVIAPVLAGGYLYAVTNYKLSKYNAATGKLIWRSVPDSGFTSYFESLAVSGNLVIVGGGDCLSVSEPSSLLMAFNATTGALVWKSGDAAAFTGLGGAVVSGSYVVTAGASADGYFTAVFNVSNGKLVWGHWDCGNGNASYLPLVVDQRVLGYSCDSQGNEEVVAYNLATGATAWRLPAGNWQLQLGDQGGSAGKHLYVTNPSGEVVDLNPATGQKVYPLPKGTTVLAVDNSRVYVGDNSSGALYAYNVSTGTLEWTNRWAGTTPPSAERQSFAEADGVLYLWAPDNGYALSASTGKVLKLLWSSASQPTALAVGDGRIAVVSEPRVVDLYGLSGY